MINNSPPGLMYREFFEIENGNIVMNEHWDIDVPGCPMIKNPWYPMQETGSKFVRQIILTRDEYDALPSSVKLSIGRSEGR